jgi:hypothetical protein
MENENNFELVTELLSKFYHKTEIEICIAISEKISLHLFVEKFNKVPLPEVKRFIFHCVLIDEFEIAIEFMTLLIPKSVFPDNPLMAFDPRITSINNIVEPDIMIDLNHD